MTRQNDFEHFERLAEQARDETPVRVDVTARVMHRLAPPAVTPARVSRTLVACAMGSLAAAGLVAAYAMQVWSDLDEPFTDLMQTLNMVMR